MNTRRTDNEDREQNESGTWDVKDGTGNVLATLASNEAAWRWLDKQDNDHWSPAARRHDWGERNDEPRDCGVDW